MRSHEGGDRCPSDTHKSFGLENGFCLVRDIKDAFAYPAAKYNRHLWHFDDKHLLMIDEIRGVQDRRVGVYGHLQTRYPVEQTNEGWEILGPNHKCTVDLLFDFGLLSEEPWEFDGPITKLVYKNYYDRGHSIQPVLFNFEDAPYTYSLNSEGFRLEIGGKIHKFNYKNGELIYMTDTAD